MVFYACAWITEMDYARKTDCAIGQSVKEMGCTSKSVLWDNPCSLTTQYSLDDYRKHLQALAIILYDLNSKPSLYIA